MGQIVMRNWDLTEIRLLVNLPSLIWRVITPIRGLLNQIRQVLPVFSLYPLVSSTSFSSWSPSLFFLSTTLPSSLNTKLSHPSQSLYAMIMRWHRVESTQSTAYTEYYIHWEQHLPKSVCLLFIPKITSRPLNVASASGVPPYTIDCHQPALHESSKVRSPCHIPTVAS